MNVHAPQSIQARNELQRLANVKYHIISAKNSSPIIGCVQDALSGCYLLTKFDNKIKGSDVANFLCNTSSETKMDIDLDKYYTGQEIFSHIIPKGINQSIIKNDKKVFEIIDGKLNIGTLSKTTLSKDQNSIIHFIWNKYGPDKTRRFIDDCQRLALSFLNYRGFTFGLKDCISNEKIAEQIDELIKEKILKYKVSLTQYENDTDQLPKTIVENNLTSELNAFSSDIGDILLKSLGPYNNLFVTVDSGSKGSLMNLQHMMGCVGQKMVEGTRIKKKVENRTLPHFHNNDDTPLARGFIENSFYKGLSAIEFLWDAMAGREGLIDTAIKSVTWETPIVIIENNEPKYTEIGKWIDNLLDINKDKIQRIKERDMELLDTKEIYIPTTDYKGNVSWGSVSAVTRHDPGTELYEIKTNGGRSVIVTESKSLLIWNNETNEFKEMLTPEIKIGDFVPVTAELLKPPMLIVDLDYWYNKYNDFMFEFEEYNTFPDELFIAPNIVVKDILKFYFEKYAIINYNSILIENINNKILNGISMLCTRVGIYGSISNNKFEIIGYYGKLFVKHIYSNENMNFNDEINVKQFNNLVLDEIVEINLIDVKKHPKVYDLTIPSTFNFGLANGLQVRDTAKTGYIQRKIIKGLEDLIIKYDNTNRDAKNVIIQYVYGENGIDQAAQTQLIIKLLSCNDKEINDNYGFTKDEIQKLDKTHKTKFDKFNIEYKNKIIEYRNNLRQIQCIANNNYKTLEEKYMLPVNLFRLTQDFSKNKVNLELNPKDIVTAIDDLLNSSETRLLPCFKDSDKNLLKDDRSLKYLFEIALHDYLCPKKCIFTYGLSKKDFDDLINEIKINFIKAMVQPGEMVGIVAAQSIGEPCSQMSQLGTDKNRIIIKNNSSNTIIMVTTEIGVFCDGIIKQNSKLTYNTGHENSVETDLSTLDNEYYIAGVDQKEKVHWNKISHVSRHPVNGQMMKVTTRSGRSIDTTLSHSHLYRNNQSVEPIKGSDLKVGMRIPVAKHIENIFIKDTIEIDGIKYKLDYIFGWFIGAYLAEGSLNNNKISISNISEHFINNTKKLANRFGKDVDVRKYLGEYGPSTSTSFTYKPLAKLIKDTCGNGSFVKRVPDFAYIAPNEFKAGLIQSYFDGDGNFNNHGSRNNIRVCSRSEQLIKDVALLFNYFDIFCHIRKDFVKGSYIYELDIATKYAELYKEHIGTLLHEDKLNDIIAYNKIDKHDVKEQIDKINGLGEIIAKCGKELQLEGQSSIYGRWKKKESIGRRTLEKYIKVFESDKNSHKIKDELDILRQAANSDVIWDEIVKIDIYTPDQDIFVYDFTVPGNQTFMCDNGIIIHNTLNTKHSAGVAGKGNMGVSRIEELLHFSRDIKTPQMTVYFDDDISADRSKVNKISSYLTHLSIKELINSAEIYYDNNSNDELSNLIKNDKVSQPFFINNQKVELSSLPFVFRIKLDMEKMHDKETTLLDIKTRFISHWTKYFSHFKNLKKNEKEIFSKIIRCAILSNNNVDNQIIHIRFSMSSFNYNLLTEFLKIVLEQITLKGIDNINNSDMVNERKLGYKDNGDMEIQKEYIVFTEGINLEKLKYIKGINTTRCNCNDIGTTYRLYGIEAARQTLLNEFMLTFQSGGANINHNHMSVLIDMMTHTGNIISIDRHGLSKIDSEPLSKASFEKTMDHFVNAAIFNEVDNVQSVSSRVMIGRVIPGGTGSFELLLDTNKLINSEYIKDERGGRITFSSLEEEQLFNDVIKFGFSKNDFFIPN